MHGTAPYIIDTYLELNSRHDHLPCPSPPDTLPRCCAVLAAGAMFKPLRDGFEDALRYQQERDVLLFIIIFGEGQH